MEEYTTTLSFHNPNIMLGSHIIKKPTFVNTFTDIIKYTPFRSMQVYVSNSRAFSKPKFDIEDILRSRKILENYSKYLTIHGSLLYNMAGSTNPSDPELKYKRERVCNGLVGELDIGVGLNSGVVVHIGSCKNKSIGIDLISKTIEDVLTRDTFEIDILSKRLGIPSDELKKNRRIILENAAGEGSKIGSKLDDIVLIYDTLKSDLRSQVKVCIDTAHIFGAGEYDLGISSELDRFIIDFDSKIGLDNLELFHLNDSKVEFGSKKDRHQCLTIGHMFDKNNKKRIKGLKTLIQFAEDRMIPLVSESPSGIFDFDVVKSIAPLAEDFSC